MLSLDLDCTAAELAARVADDVLLDDLHRPAIDRDTARALIVEQQNKLAAEASRAREAEEAWRKRLAPMVNRNSERVLAIQAKAAALREAGAYPDDASIFERLAGDEARERADRRAELANDLLRGRMSGAFIRVPHGD